MIFDKEKCNLYQNETGDQITVKAGWSWWPIIFGVFWALYYRLWGAALAMLGFAIILVAFLNFGVPKTWAQHSEIILFGSVIMERLFWGFSGNRFLEKRLLSQGFVFIKSIKVNKTLVDLGPVDTTATITVESKTSPTKARGAKFGRSK